MRAIVLDHFGGLDSLVIKEIPEPEPEPGSKRKAPWFFMSGSAALDPKPAFAAVAATNAAITALAKA